MWLSCGYHVGVVGAHLRAYVPIQEFVRIPNEDITQVNCQLYTSAAMSPGVHLVLHSLLDELFILFQSFCMFI